MLRCVARSSYRVTRNLPGYLEGVHYILGKALLQSTTPASVLAFGLYMCKLITVGNVLTHGLPGIFNVSVSPENTLDCLCNETRGFESVIAETHRLIRFLARDGTSKHARNVYTQTALDVW